MSTSPSYLVYIQQYADAGSTQSAISITAPMPEEVMFDTESTYEMMLPQGFTSNKLAVLAGAVTGVRLAVQAMTAQLWSGSTTGDLSIPLEFHTENDPVQDVQTPILNLLKLTVPSINSAGLLQSPGPSLDLSALTSSNTSTTSPINPSSQTNSQSTFSTSVPVPSILGGLSSPSTMINTGQQVSDGTNYFAQQSNQQNPSLGTGAYWTSKVKNRISIQIGTYMLFDNVVVTRVSQTYVSNFDAQTGLPHHVKVQLSFRPMFMLTQQDLNNVFLNSGSYTPSGSNNYGFTLPNNGAGSQSLPSLSSYTPGTS